MAEVSLEAATGGPIGKVRDGDVIRISVANRSIDINISAEALERRKGPGYRVDAFGYLRIFREAVQPM